MVFQSFALFPWLTVFENVALGLEAQRMSRAEIRKRSLAAIDLIGLELENLPVSRRETPHAQSRLCVYRDIVWSRIALAKDRGGQDRNVPYTCDSGLGLRSLDWWTC